MGVGSVLCIVCVSIVNVLYCIMYCVLVLFCIMHCVSIGNVVILFCIVCGCLYCIEQWRVIIGHVLHCSAYCVLVLVVYCALCVTIGYSVYCIMYCVLVLLM